MAKFTKLKFDKDRVQQLLVLSQKAEEREPTYDQLYDPRCRKDGQEPEDRSPSPDEVDGRKVPVGLQLVKDDGIYLMSNAADPSLFEGGKRRDVTYARGFDPDQVAFDDWWDLSRAAMGGDDQAIFLEEKLIQGALNRAAGKTVVIEVKTDESGQYVEFVRG
jgi:hypothetical protein